MVPPTEEGGLWTYRVVEWAGRWSMMDVLLLALMVTLVKLGDLVQFSLGPAVFAFVMCVIMSLIASTIRAGSPIVWRKSCRFRCAPAKS